MCLECTPEKIFQGPVPRHEIHFTLECQPHHCLRDITLPAPLTRKLERLHGGIEIDITAKGDIATEVFLTFSCIKHVCGLAKHGFKAKYSRECDNPEKRHALTRRTPDSAASHYLETRYNSFAPRHAETDGKWMNSTSLDLHQNDPGRTHDRLFIRELFSDSYQPKAKTVIGIFASATGARRQPGEWWNDFIIAPRKALPGSGPVAIIAAAVDEGTAHQSRASHLALATAGLESDA